MSGLDDSQSFKSRTGCSTGSATDLLAGCPPGADRHQSVGSNRLGLRPHYADLRFAEAGPAARLQYLLPRQNRDQRHRSQPTMPGSRARRSTPAYSVSLWLAWRLSGLIHDYNRRIATDERIDLTTFAGLRERIAMPSAG